MKDQLDSNLLARYLSGECSENERAEVKAWINANPDHQKWISLAHRIWQTKQQIRDVDIERLWKQVRQKAGVHSVNQNPKQRIRIYPWSLPRQAVRLLRIAAVLILAFVLGYRTIKGHFPGFPNPYDMQEMSVDYGKRANVILSDESQITLDAGSRLRYPKKWRSGPREVFLEGEAFFNVAKDSASPFIVRAQGATILVLGTRFNVRAWNPVCCVKVAVVEGKVAFNGEKAAQENQVILTRGQMSMLSEDLTPLTPVQIDPVQEIGWMRGEIQFKDAPLREVLDQLERWHDITFICSNSIRLDEHVSVHIKEKSLKDILELVSLLSGLHVVQKNKIIYIN